MKTQLAAGPQWVDAQEIMQLLYISPATLKRWRRLLLIGHSKIGGKILYDKKSVLEYLERNKREGSRLK